MYKYKRAHFGECYNFFFLYIALVDSEIWEGQLRKRPLIVIANNFDHINQNKKIENSLNYYKTVDYDSGFK